MPGSNNSLASVQVPVMDQQYPSSSPVLHPAARGSLLCFCYGEVVEMSSQYGWLKVYGEVDHPLADKHGGHIFVHKQDVARGIILTSGDRVTFYLYADGKGLGAEVCKSVESTGNGRDAQASWRGKKCGSNRPPHSEVSPQPLQKAMYYLPYNAVNSGHLGAHSPTMACTLKQDKNETAGAMTNYNMASKKCAAKDDASFERTSLNGEPPELPSVGSIGHSDGSCKRCAFFPKGRCLNGRDCTHCHFDHTMRTRLRKRKQNRTRTDETETVASIQGGNNEQDEETSALSNLARIGAVLIACTSSAVEEQSEVGDIPSDDDTDDISQKGDAATATTAASSSSASDDEEASLAPQFFSEDAPGVEEDRMCGKESSSEASDSEISTSCDCISTSKSEDGDVTPVASPKLSWSAQLRLRRAGGINKEVSAEEIARMARSLLNKLTHDKFESLSAQILALPFSTPEQLASLVAEIFEKATTEEGFRSLYTDLCVRLDAYLVKQDTAVGGKAFRKALANECQATFERYLQPADPTLFSGLTGDECFEVEMKLKTRRLGNMRFIGDLLACRLLAHKLMLPIILQLLDGDETALESLVAFLMVIGPVFDCKDSVYSAPMRDAFARLRRRKTQKELSCRLQCHLSDLFDARARGWAPRSA